MSETLIYRRISSAEGNFMFANGDVRVLLRLHDGATRSAAGRPRPELEVLKRAAVILIVTAWESYIEDALISVASRRIDSAKKPSDTGKAFLAIAQHWLDERPKPPDVEQWVGENWKVLLKRRLSTEVRALNTPNTANVAKLTLRYLGVDITKKWRWPSTSSEKATRRLDELVELRGRLVHRGKAFSLSTAAAVTRPSVVRGMELVARLVDCTERAILALEPRGR
jgi:hypothetical protein